MVNVNIVAVVLAALAMFVIGFLMHGPLLGKLWMKLANVHPTGNEKFSDMAPQLLKNLLVNLVFAYVFAIVYALAVASPALGGAGVANGIKLAVLIWFGFVCTTTSIEVIWMGRSYKLWLFECFASLAACIAMGAIIAAF